MSLHQRRVGHGLEDGERRGFRRDHGLVFHQEGLLQRVLAGENRVRNHVGVDHPTGAGGKLQVFLAALRLERCVLLEEVVEAHHEVVIGRSLQTGDRQAQAGGVGQRAQRAAGGVAGRREAESVAAHSVDASTGKGSLTTQSRERVG